MEDIRPVVGDTSGFGSHGVGCLCSMCLRTIHPVAPHLTLPVGPSPVFHLPTVPLAPSPGCLHGVGLGRKGKESTLWVGSSCPPRTHPGTLTRTPTGPEVRTTSVLAPASSSVTSSLALPRTEGRPDRTLPPWPTDRRATQRSKIYT